MKNELSDSQLKKLTTYIQSIIDAELNFLKQESEDWGLGEMDEIDEVQSIEKIEIDRIVPHTGIKVYINIYTTSDREEFNNVRSEIQYRLESYLPKIKLFINLIINNDDLYLSEMEMIVSTLKEEYSSMKDNILFFKRHIYELNKHIHEIINEWYFHYDMCRFETYQEYQKDVVFSSAITLINSYDELYSHYNQEFENMLEDYILNRYKKFIKQEWDEKECD
jgi:hypothetical protein